MLKKLRLIILVLSAIIWFVFVLPYLLIQTEFGSKQISQIISNSHGQYTISVGRISHSLNTPYEVTLENVIIKDKAQTVTYLLAKKLVIGLKKTDLFQINEFDYILIEEGELNCSLSNQYIASSILQLKNVSLHYVDPLQNNQLTLTNMQGAIKPWSSHFISEQLDTQFTFTIKKALYNNLNIQSILLKGSQQEGILNIDKLGGNINQGFFTTSTTIDQNHHVEIEQLKINNIHFQSSIPQLTLNTLITEIPKITIQSLSVINSSVDLPDLNIEKANIAADHFSYDKGLQLEDSNLTFNAESMLWRDQLIYNPLLSWQSENGKIMIKHAMGRWNKGTITLSGDWQNDYLSIKHLLATGIHYQLPDNWYQSLNNLRLPDFFPSKITIENLTLMPSLLLERSPDFPFQLTSFEAFGRNLNLTSSEEKTSINGVISLRADSGTFNRVEVQKPDLLLNMTKPYNNITFSALIGQGVVEGEVNLSATDQIESSTLNAYSVDSQILASWKLVKNPIFSDQFSLTLHGQLIPMSLEGSIKVDDKNYQIIDNQVIN